MSYQTSEPIEVKLTTDDAGTRYAAGPYRSTNYGSDAELAAAIARRFPNARIDGKTLVERFPVLATVPPEALAPPAPLPPATPQPEPPSMTRASETLAKAIATPERKRPSKKAEPAKKPAEADLWD